MFVCLRDPNHPTSIILDFLGTKLSQFLNFVLIKQIINRKINRVAKIIFLEEKNRVLNLKIMLYTKEKEKNEKNKTNKLTNIP